MKHKIIFSILALIIHGSLILSVPTMAQNSQYGQYGQYGQTREDDKKTRSPTKAPESLLVDKQIAVPGTDANRGVVTSRDLVDNLTADDPHFRSGEQVISRIRIKNTSSVALRDIILSDALPDILDPESGPGRYDVDSHTITYTIDELGPQEEQSYDIVARVLPTAQAGIFCTHNTATVDNGRVSDQDTSQFCIEGEREVQEVVVVSPTQAPQVRTVPRTGPGLGLLLLAGNILGLGTGIYLKKIK